MRRSDREVTDIERIKEIVSECSCCRLGFNDENGAYIVPLCFGCGWENNELTLYFHSAKEGRKLELIKKGGRAGFEMDKSFMVKPGKAACDFSAGFQSVIGYGSICFIENATEKAEALDKIMAHNTGREGWEYPSAMLASVCLFKLKAESLTCKENL